MSKSHITKIECPKCGQSSDFRIWESINTSLDPEMKEKVKDRSAFLFTCPHCGEKNLVDYGFLYHQMEDTIMIGYANSDDNEKQLYHLYTEGFDGAHDLDNVFQKEEYLLRIVRSLNALREKIFIFDDGLDDRVIEIYKLFVYVKLVSDNPDAENAEIFYFGGEEPRFEVIISKNNMGVVAFSKGTYEILEREYGSLMPELRHDDPIIDRAYAMKFLRSKGNNE